MPASEVWIIATYPFVIVPATASFALYARWTWRQRDRHAELWHLLFGITVVALALVVENAYFMLWRMHEARLLPAVINVNLYALAGPVAAIKVLAGVGAWFHVYAFLRAALGGLGWGLRAFWIASVVFAAAAYPTFALLLAWLPRWSMP